MAASVASHDLLMIPGPVEMTDAVREAAGGAALSHMDSGFAARFSELINMVRQVVVTKTGQPYIIAGSGSLGWDAFSANMLESGDHAVVINTGYFGDRWVECMEAYGVDVTQVRAPVTGIAPSLDEIFATLKGAKKPVKAVTVTAVDTSTGVAMDVKAVAETIRRAVPNALIAVDGVCSVGAEALYFDDWGIDYVMTGSQKALGAPPGLAIMVASQRAMATLKSRKTPVPCYYASLQRWLPIMEGLEVKVLKYFATPAVQLVQSLHVSLTEIMAASSVPERFAQHDKVSSIVKDTLESWGLSLVTGNRASEANTLSAVVLPEGLEVSDVVPRAAKRGVILSGGLLPGIKYFRIGHMHLSAMQPGLEHMSQALAAVWGALHDAGYKPQAPRQGWTARLPASDRAPLLDKVVKSLGEDPAAAALSKWTEVSSKDEL